MAPRNDKKKQRSHRKDHQHDIPLTPPGTTGGSINEGRKQNANLSQKTNQTTRDFQDLIPASPPIAAGLVLKPSSSGISNRKKRKLDIFDVEEVTQNNKFETTASIIRVVPKKCKLEIGGFTLIPRKNYADSNLVAPLFKPKGSELKTEYVKTLGCVMRVVQCIEDDGRTIGSVGANGNFYATGSLAFACDDDWSFNNVANHINNVVRPNAIRICNETMKNEANLSKGRQTFRFKCKESDWVYLEENETKARNNGTYREVNLWSEAIKKDSDIPFIINHELCSIYKGENKRVPTFREWCLVDKNHLYTCWKVGEVPIEIIEAFKLFTNRECLEDADYQRYLLYIQDAQDGGTCTENE